MSSRQDIVIRGSSTTAHVDLHAARHQLGAGLAYLERVGVERIERHTVELARELRAGLASQGYRLFTPEGNRSSIVTFYFSKDEL